MEGKEYRSRGARVRVDDQGIDVHDWYIGGLRLPWPVILEIRDGTRAVRGVRRRCLELGLVDGTSLILPAPIEPPGGSALFEKQARELSEAHRAHGGSGGRTGPAGEVQDEIPVRYRLDQLRRVEVYARPSRLPLLAKPVMMLMLLLFLVELVGIAGSVHSYTRDLGAYDAYRAAKSCTASDAAEGSAGPAYCVVTDGVVTQAVSPIAGMYSIDVGPAANLDESATQFSFFKADPSALDGLSVGTPVDYVTADGGDVDSISYGGETYQTIESPQPQNVYDWASIFAVFGWTLLTGSLIALRLTRRSVVSWWAVPVLTITAALIVNLAVAANQPAAKPLGSLGALLGLTGTVALATAAGATALCLFVFRPRARRPVYLRHRGLP